MFWWKKIWQIIFLLMNKYFTLLLNIKYIMSLSVTKNIFLVLDQWIYIIYMREITTLKLNQLSLKIRFIIFQIKHILSRKVWLSLNEEKKKIKIIFLLILTWFFKDYSLKPWNLSKILKLNFKVVLHCLYMFNFLKTKQNQNIILLYLISSF
jgi:hypothetical protein